ncbi:MAG: MFS transporter [Fimbriimonadaceae bacterium]
MSAVPVESKLPLIRRPAIARLLLMALLAEIGYAVLNLSTMPVYLKFDRGYGGEIIGLVLGAFLLSEAVFKGPMGHFADRIGRRRLLVLGPGLTVFTSLATLGVPHHWGVSETVSLIALRALDGLGAAMFWPAAFALIGDSVGDHERQQAMSLLNLCYLIGVALAFPIGGAFNDLVGPHLEGFTGARSASLYLAAGLFLSVSLTAYFSVASGRAHRAAARLARESRSGPPEEGGLRALIAGFRQIPEYLLLSVITFAGIGFPMAIIKLFAKEEFRMSESGFGILVLPAVLLMAACSVPMSKLGERIGRPRAVHLGMGLCVVGLTIVASGMFVVALRQPASIAVGGVFVGFGFLLAIPAWMASVSDIDPLRRGANIGAIMTAQGVGAIIGLPIGSTLYAKLQPVGVQLGLGESFGRYSPFLGCAICVLIGWLLSLKILKAR